MLRCDAPGASSPYLFHLLKLSTSFSSWQSNVDDMYIPQFLIVIQKKLHRQIPHKFSDYKERTTKKQRICSSLVEIVLFRQIKRLARLVHSEETKRD